MMICVYQQSLSDKPSKSTLRWWESTPTSRSTYIISIDRRMGYNFLPYDQDQQFHLPPSLPDWVNEYSLEGSVSDLIAQLDNDGRLEPFYASYREDGWSHPAYHPVMLLKVLVFR